jgi:hypothetical protein
VHQNTNNYRKSIIELCSDSQLRILNGRTLGDSVGKATYVNDGAIYKKQINRSLSNPNKYTFNLNHIIFVIDLSTNVISVDICLLIKTASPPRFLLDSLLLQFMYIFFFFYIYFTI